MVDNGKWAGSFRRKDPVWHVASQTVERRLAAVTHYLPLAAQLADEDLEYVHQLRVSTRRMVAALDLYGDFLPKKPTKRLRRKLKEIRRAAGNARDCDVLLIRHESCCGDPRAELFIQSVRRKRSEAQAPISAVFQSLRGKESLENLLNTVATTLEREHEGERRPRFGPWSREQLQEMVDEFFAAQPGDLHDLEGLHEFRIAGKRLRYTIELLASPFPDQLRAKLYPKIELIQESLGDINDHAVALNRFRQWRQETDHRLEKDHLKTLIKREKRSLKQAVAEFADWWTPQRRRKLLKRFRQLTKTD